MSQDISQDEAYFTAPEYFTLARDIALSMPARHFQLIDLMVARDGT